jgi:hypothetical protein
MAGPIRLALIFLVGICALAALKISIATPPKQLAAFAEDVIQAPVNALAKTDKLEVEQIPDKKAIRSIAIVPQTAASIPEKSTKVMSRDWKDGFAKLKMRKRHHHHHHRHVSQKRHRRG